MRQSFLPQSIREWNELEDEVKEATTIAITKHKPKPNRVYNLEYTCASAIEMTRLRCENGNLKENLHSQSLALSSLRECDKIESDYHYFITCPLYDNRRQTAMDSVPGRDWILQDIYHGNDTKLDDFNEKLQMAAQKYIDETERFY